jgi:hypothetical protein
MIQVTERFVQHPRAHISEPVQAHHRRYQGGNCVAPGDSVMACQVTLIVIVAMAVMRVHRGLLWVFL